MFTTIMAGLSVGAIYAIVAVGYNIIFVASRLFNFAQAQFMMIGAFVALEAGTRFNLPILITIVLCAAIGAAIGALEEYLAVRRLAGGDTHNELITTLGVATILSGVAFIIWGPDPNRVPYLSELGAVELLGGRVLLSDILIISFALIITGGVALVSRKTMIGLVSLATSEDRQAAMLRGVNVKALALGSFAVAGALVAAAGPLVAVKTYAIYDLGDALAVKAFLAMAIGGFGSYLGALIGGLIVGLLEVLSARYLGGEVQGFTVFVVLLVVLLVLPNGIFNRTKERVV